MVLAICSCKKYPTPNRIIGVWILKSAIVGNSENLNAPLVYEEDDYTDSCGDHFNYVKTGKILWDSVEFKEDNTCFTEGKCVVTGLNDYLTYNHCQLSYFSSTGGLGTLLGGASWEISNDTMLSIKYIVYMNPLHEYLYETKQFKLLKSKSNELILRGENLFTCSGKMTTFVFEKKK